MATPSTSALVLFAHGSRDPLWAEPFHRIRAILQARAPAVPIELAFLDHMQPPLGAAIDALANRGVERITLVPLFMAQGGHLRHDLPQIVGRACAANPGVVVRTVNAIGDVEALLEAIAAWILQEHERTDRNDLGNPVA